MKPLYYARDAARRALRLRDQGAAAGALARPRARPARGRATTCSTSWCPGAAHDAAQRAEARAGLRAAHPRRAASARALALLRPALRPGARRLARRTTPSVQVRKTCSGAVERQLVADVPVGAFLSGGLDSSASSRSRAPRSAARGCSASPSASASASARTRAWPRTCPTRSAWRSTSASTSTRSRWGRRWSTSCRRWSSTSTSRRPIRRRSTRCSSPSLAREHGIKVLLSGAGGDDIFTGYRRHHALAMEPWWAWLPAGARRGLRTASQQVPPDHASCAGGSARPSATPISPATSGSPAYFHWIAPGRLRALYHRGCCREGCGPPDHDLVLEALDAALGSSPPLHRMLYLEAKFFLADHNLNYTDKISMASGVEVRVPLPRPRAGHARGAAAARREAARAHGQVGAAARDGALPAARGDRPQEDGLRRAAAPLAAPRARAASSTTRFRSATLARRGLFDPDGGAAARAAGSRAPRRRDLHDLLDDLHRAVVPDVRRSADAERGGALEADPAERANGRARAGRGAGADRRRGPGARAHRVLRRVAGHRDAGDGLRAQARCSARRAAAPTWCAR